MKTITLIVRVVLDGREGFLQGVVEDPLDGRRLPFTGPDELVTILCRIKHGRQTQPGVAPDPEDPRAGTALT